MILKFQDNAFYFIYIVLTSCQKFYTGISLNPIIRVAEHNKGKRGAKCLRGQSPVRLVWHLPFPISKSNALRLERKIKNLSHSKKQEIIDKYNKGEVFIFSDGERLW